MYGSVQSNNSTLNQSRDSTVYRIQLPILLVFFLLVTLIMAKEKHNVTYYEDNEIFRNYPERCLRYLKIIVRKIDHDVVR